MDRWVGYAFLSMFFAGFTSVIAKLGLLGISGELGLAIRSIFVCFFVLLFAILSVPAQELINVTVKNLAWLGLSSVTTAFSWVFYYKALKGGDVVTVALIDKGSVVVAMFLAWLFLKEHITLRMISGLILIVIGVFVVAKKN
ncbi:EamA family transporter [Pseudomonas sp. RC4D1]|uniref:EamA family transporter n=1 Tax=Pseudomonas sp. RC4D1 TaxID=2834407 RepID=UPI001BCDF2D8|nr:EamA family transporter [Pseudomonas sp. RC4D1]MBS7560105.1 EamA family transporter [Pseudomonas sp. RC4D1]